MISFKEFQKMDIRIGTVKKVEEIPGSKNLYKLKVSIGDEEKQAVAGLKGHYTPEELKGEQFVFIMNLEQKRLMGELSEVMILAATRGDRVVLLKPEKDIEEGSRIS